MPSNGGKDNGGKDNGGKDNSGKDNGGKDNGGKDNGGKGNGDNSKPTAPPPPGPQPRSSRALTTTAVPILPPMPLTTERKSDSNDEPDSQGLTSTMESTISVTEVQPTLTDTPTIQNILWIADLKKSQTSRVVLGDTVTPKANEEATPEANIVLPEGAREDNSPRNIAIAVFLIVWLISSAVGIYIYLKWRARRKSNQARKFEVLNEDSNVFVSNSSAVRNSLNNAPEMSDERNGNFQDSVVPIISYPQATHFPSENNHENASHVV
jgi:hypothetical protein